MVIQLKRAGTKDKTKESLKRYTLYICFQKNLRAVEEGERDKERRQRERDSQHAHDIKVKTETQKVKPPLDSLLCSFTV